MREIRRATWSEVKSKGLRLISEDKIEILDMSSYALTCRVQGDHDTYLTYVNKDARVNGPANPIERGSWFCSCPWGGWCNYGDRPHDGPDSTGSVKTNNRFCSHAYAVYQLLREYGDNKSYYDSIEKNREHIYKNPGKQKRNRTRRRKR